jgi:hypothetical protein
MRGCTPGVLGLASMDDREKKWIETTVAWVGYSIALLGFIAFFLTLVRP